jgi:hypothetical protein
VIPVVFHLHLPGLGWRPVHSLNSGSTKGTGLDACRFRF